MPQRHRDGPAPLGQQVDLRIGELLVQLLNHDDPADQASELRTLGQHLCTLSAGCLARAAKADGRLVEAQQRVVIDARDQTPGRCG